MTTAYLLIAAGAWALGLVVAFGIGMWVERGRHTCRPQLPWPPPATRAPRGPRSSWLARQRPVHGELHDTALLPATRDGRG